MFEGEKNRDDFIYFASTILDASEEVIRKAVNDHTIYLNKWAQCDGHDELMDCTKLIFDTNSKFEIIGVLKGISCVCNHSLREKYTNYQIVRGCIHYALSMCKYQASGVDPLFVNRTGDYLAEIGIFLAFSEQSKCCRRHYIVKVDGEY